MYNKVYNIIMIINHKKIVIIVDSGRGKTTFAEKLGIIKHSTDDFFWEIKFTKPRDKKESVEMIEKYLDHDSWIIEGTTRHLTEKALPLADIIFYLTYSNIFSQWLTIIKRSLKRKNENIR